ncbi:methionine--tRNA ligase, partial [Candidatus Kaiserbacteria bacterium CG_4_8_14_3_um_filter_38_9]
FKLSNYQKQLEEYLSDTTRTVSEPYRKWALEFVSDGLEDLSISRNKSRLDWGIPVPDDSEQVMYVWFDALTNYISTLGWPDDIEGKFEKFWLEGETLQLAGKDQVRFQSIIWQAMLMSADIKQTDTIAYHGFINSGGQKMSKSLGNVISPYDLVNKYGTEATRYLLLRHVHPSDDTDITWERLDEWYTANLVNGLGNLVARIMKMSETHLEAPIVILEAEVFAKEYTDALDVYNFQGAGDYVWSRIGLLDERITNEEPFKLVKIESEKAKIIIQELVQELYLIARLINPVMPETSAIIKNAVLTNKKPDNLFNRLDV